MRQGSAFTPVELPSRPAPGGGWTRGALAALDGCSFSIPLSIGAAALVYARHAPDLLPAAVLATLLGLALVQLCGLPSHRPLLFSARFLEVTTISAMLDTVADRLPEWGVADSSATRVAALVAIVALAGVVVGFLQLVRADRFTRFIPTPVYAGLANSVAVGLLLSQVPILESLVWGPGSRPAVALLIVATVFATGLAVRWWVPRWPAAACALLVGVVLAAVSGSAGFAQVTLGDRAGGALLPVFAADFAAYAAAAGQWTAMSGLLAGNALVLGTIMFLNTAITSQVLSHHDDQRVGPRATLVPSALGMAAAGLLGAVPLSGALQTSLAAGRTAPLGIRVGAPVVALTLAVAASGIERWIPVAAVCGIMLCEAWFVVDRGSLLLANLWLRRQPMPQEARENLALVVAATVTAVAFNMVAAVAVALLLGLVLFAARNAQRPVRAVLTGAQISSNCARPRTDIQRLERHGQEIRIVELEGDLFFASVDALDRQFTQLFEDARCVVIHWDGVRHVDTSAADLVARLQRTAAALDIPLIHVDPARASAEIAQTLRLAERGARIAPDLDHALEAAENHLLAQYGPDPDAANTSVLDGAAGLVRGLSDADRQRLDACMPHRLFRAGETLVRAGDPGDELLLVLQGSASVLVPDSQGRLVRIAGVRRGAVVGEVAFLDGTARSATVRADEDVTAAVLARTAYEDLSREAPMLVRQLIGNLALDLATRLRHTNRLATARQARH